MEMNMPEQNEAVYPLLDLSEEGVKDRVRAAIAGRDASIGNAMEALLVLAQYDKPDVSEWRIENLRTATEGVESAMRELSAALRSAVAVTRLSTALSTSGGHFGGLVDL